MSRGDRVAVKGNLSASMRDNYGEHGVAEYYKRVGASYRNPHYPGIRLCLYSWLNRWWKNEQESIAKLTVDQIMLFDMACGSGEVTLVFFEWCKNGKRLYQESLNPPATNSTARPIQLPQKKGLVIPTPLGPGFPRPYIAAADPFTAAAYKERTSYECSDLSFEAIAEGLLPEMAVNIVDSSIKPVMAPSGETTYHTKQAHLVEMVVCSFAMHLIEDPSILFTLLWQLSLRARWLVILAPHKRPEIKDGWGWSKWDIDTWSESPMSSHAGEVLHDRVHCRAYRSVNV